MAYRSFSTGTWKDPWFEGLSPKAKLLFIYLWTNDTCNQAGMYQISLKRIEFDVGFSGVREILDTELKGKVQWFSQHAVIWVKNFFKYQCANEKFAIAALKSLETLPQQLKGIFATYNKDFFEKYGINLNQYGIDTVSIPYNDSIDTYPLSGPGPDTDTVSDTGTEYRLPSNEGSQPVSDETGSPQQAASVSQKVVSLRKKEPPCPHMKIIELYHEILPELPAVKGWNETRRGWLRARWKEKPEYQSLDWWKKFFQYVRESDFLMGKVERKNGDKPFMADLEWLIRPNNFLKVIEGRYHNRDPATGQYRELANKAWQQMLKAISRGEYKFSDPVIDEVIEELGGLRAVRFWEKKDMCSHEKNFKRTYQRICGKRGVNTEVLGS